MTPDNIDPQLNVISTQWSLVYRAHHGPADEANSARRQLLDRYGGAARRYLCKVLHDPDAAADVFQEFALRLVHGDLRGANSERGRFRDFVKGTLFHLVSDHHKRQRHWPHPLPDEGTGLVANRPSSGSDREFVASWCDEFLARAWANLKVIQDKNGGHSYTVLRFRADHSDMRSPELAARLTEQVGTRFTAASVRQTLHRAREKFAELLLNEVADSLENPTAERLEDELVELGLLEYCRPALERHTMSPVRTMRSSDRELHHPSGSSCYSRIG